MKAGEADIALTIEAGFATRTTTGIECTPLMDDPMYVALPATTALAPRRGCGSRTSRRAVDPGLDRATCPDARILMRACQSAGFEPRIVFQLDDYPAIQGFVAAGVGVSLIPDLALHQRARRRGRSARSGPRRRCAISR